MKKYIATNTAPNMIRLGHGLGCPAAPAACA
jgi:hypothetical protein